MKCPKCKSEDVFLEDDSFSHDWYGGGVEIIRYFVCNNCEYAQEDNDEDWGQFSEVVE